MRRNPLDSSAIHAAAQLGSLLIDIGCGFPGDLAHHPGAERAQAARWAESILFGEDDGPERPAWLASYDCRRCRRCGCTDARGCADGCEWADEDLCSLCVSPTSLRELIAFLGRRPSLRCLHFDGHDYPELFHRASDSGLWFRRILPDGSVRDMYLPIGCRLGKGGASEGGLTFEPDGFSFTKFKLPVRYTYCRGPNG